MRDLAYFQQKKWPTSRLTTSKKYQATCFPSAAIAWEEPIIPSGWSTVAFQSGDAIGRYIQSRKTAIARTRHGQGTVYSFGFEYGYAYARKEMPVVPSQYGRTEMHPLVLLKRTPLEAMIGPCPDALMAPSRGIEVGRFGDHAIMVNHRAQALDITSIHAVEILAQVQSAPGWLAGHSAVCIRLA